MPEFTINITPEQIQLIKEHFGFTALEDVGKQLTYWIDLSISEVIIKEAIKRLEKQVIEENS